MTEIDFDTTNNDGTQGIISGWKKEDFSTPAPYEYIYKNFGKDKFLLELKLNEMSDIAFKLTGMRNFKKVYASYVETVQRQSNTIYLNNVTNFQGQPLELEVGDWQADDFGVTRRNGIFEEQACCHPILPVERLVNIDTGVEKLKIAYSKGKKWREVIADKKTLASTQSIISLADVGIAVNSDNAKYLVKYLHDIENLNYDIIPEKKSVSRLGYIEDEGFSPYFEGLIFDGDANFRNIFNSIKSKGDRKKWLDVALKIRQGNVMARIVLAASFASVLVAPLGGLPFFVHLWGGESGTGKTVALMLAASVWGDPFLGKYIQTFNSTVVGREKLVAFLNHLPLLVDELQLARDNRGKLQFDIYTLAEGVGRTRGTKTGGVDMTPTWANCIITTGETPMTSNNSGSGAVNRIIEIECLPNEKIIEDGHGVSTEIKKNYGFAGREFVEKLYSDDSNIEKAQELYKQVYKAFSENDTTEKQAMAAAIILVADTLAAEWIFKDERALTVEEISEFLQSRAAANANERAYRYLCDWVTQNANKLKDDADGEVYGLISGGWVYIINSVFHKVVNEAGFSSKALLSYLKKNDMIQTRGRNNTRGKRINGVLTECVVMKLIADDMIDDVAATDFVEVSDDGELPF